MKRASLAGQFVGSILALLLLVGCGAHYQNLYMQAVTQNQQGLQELRLGMSLGEVYATMGNTIVIHYKKINFVDPWRSESFQLVDGTHVLILFYMTEPGRRYSKVEHQSLTPIVIENDVLKGWGWSYLRRNTDYGVKYPRQQD